MDYEFLPCPFCGYEKIGIRYHEGKYYGQRYDGIKKIQFVAYACCNKCHSRGKPISYVCDYVNERGWLTRMKKETFPKAVEEWNGRRK